MPRSDSLPILVLGTEEISVTAPEIFPSDLRSDLRPSIEDDPSLRVLREISHLSQSASNIAGETFPGASQGREIDPWGIPSITSRTRTAFTSRSTNNKVNARSVNLARDRFIPRRRSPTACLKSFHTNKPLYKLSSVEKLLRQRSASPDPFSSPSQNRRYHVERVPPRAFPPRIYGLRSYGPAGSGVLEIHSGGSRDESRTTPQPSVGSFWNVGGDSAAREGPTAGVSDGRGGYLSSGSNAPMYVSRFLDGTTAEQKREQHEGRLALALDFDQARRVLEFSSPSDTTPDSSPNRSGDRSGSSIVGKRRRDAGTSGVVWQDNHWVNLGSPTLLDAPQLRDDFYCSLLAYSHTTHSLAVGLNHAVFLWSEEKGVQPLTPYFIASAYLTSLSFSSTEGGHSILAIGRSSGHLSLWSLHEDEPRFELFHAEPISCTAWRPRVTERLSEDETRAGQMVATEDLLVGDESGVVYYYTVECSYADELFNGGWHGATTLIGRIAVHAQQICGLTWSPDGDFFATGGNDNACCLFATDDVRASCSPTDARGERLTRVDDFIGIDGWRRQYIFPKLQRFRPIGPARVKHKWKHGAAVKAIAFCPWQKGLIATGGGSNDRCIHFYHTDSGACLATINVAAQVTSLIWSSTRREIAATFGYASPEHPYRIAVFSWPQCRQLVAIPWSGDLRALYAIPYPGTPNHRESKEGEGGIWASGTAEEGCIVVAASDESVKFHEVWSNAKRSVGEGGKGLLGGSDILESLEGFDKEGTMTIR